MTHHRSIAGHRIGTRAALVLAGLAACSDSTDANDSTGPSEATQGDSAEQTGGDETGGGDPGILVGSFQLQLTEPKPATDGSPATPGTTSIFGKIYDGPTPEQLVWEPGMQADACQLLTPRVPFCNTPCGGSAACVEDDTCQDYPEAHSAGPVHVSGVATAAGESSFTMEPIANNYQAPASSPLAYPGFAAADPISVEADGDEVGGFALSASGVDPLELTADDLTLDRATDLDLTWVAATAGDSVIQVKLDISHHGGTKGKLECETADTGSLSIPAAMVAALLDLGVSGFPTIVVTRSATGSATTSAGRIDLVVSAGIERTVLIEGLTSCTDDSACPDGQSCQPDLSCA